MSKLSKKYDYLIVGAGLFGSVFAREMADRGKKCFVIDKREHIGGNLYCEECEGINVHKYGAHIFHTSNKHIWDYVNKLAEFNRYTNSPIANYKGKLYHMPFNMNTFYAMWGTITPAQAKAKIKEQIEKENIIEPKNLEEKAITMIGRDLYEILIKGYTEKQWGKAATQLPPFIINRLPLRFTFDDNYFNDKYQGIPIGGYNKLFLKLLNGIDVELNVNYFSDKDYFYNIADKIVYTGELDRYFEYSLGKLEYRSLRFENEILDTDNYQGVAVVNYTDADIPFTRIIEHKHFEYTQSPKTVITREYPQEWLEDNEPYYPVNNQINNDLYEKYKKLAQNENKLIVGGRLGMYKYFDMDKIIEAALTIVENELIKN